VGSGTGKGKLNGLQVSGWGNWNGAGMVIVDSSVWIDFLRGSFSAESAWLRRAISRTEIGLTTLIFSEVLQGTANDRRFRETREYLMDFPIFEGCDRRIAVAAAQNFRTLRSRAVTVRSTIDCLTATFCIQAGYHLLHRDRDFVGFERYLNLLVFKP
jgi:predicted nucleic acid-binding protein